MTLQLVGLLVMALQRYITMAIIQLLVLLSMIFLEVTKFERE